MYKRTLAKPSVSVGLLIVLVCSANAHETIQAARDEVVSLIDAGDFVAANTAIEQMIKDFADDPALPEILCRIAYKYEKVEALSQARSLNARIAADFPEHQYGVYAALQLAKLRIYEQIDAGDFESAGAAVTRMAAHFVGNENLARRLWEVANRYDKAEAFDYSKALCERIAANHPEDVYATYARLQLAKLGAFDLIHTGDYESVHSTVSQMMSDFAGHKQLPRRLWEIANRYEKFKAFGHSKKVCQRIVADYPQDEYATYARLELAKLEVYELIGKGSYEAADSAALKMMTDFAGHKQLTRRLYEIAQAYPDAGAWEHGKVLHDRIAAAYPGDKYGSRSAIQAAKLNIYGLINSGDLDGAAEAVSQIKTTYAGHELFFSTLESVAERYAIVGQHEAARTLYQQIIQQCPADRKAAAVAKAGLGRCDISSAIRSGNDTAADAAISQLLSELARSEYQQEAIHSLAYGLYTDCLAAASQMDDSALVANYALKIISLLENHLLVLNLPVHVRADAYLMLAECYDRLEAPSAAREYYQKYYDTSPGYRLECYAKHMVARCLERELKLGLVSEDEAKPRIREIHQNILSDYPECDAVEYAQEWLEKNPQ